MLRHRACKLHAFLGHTPICFRVLHDMGKTSRSGSGCRVSLSRRLLKRVWLVRVDALKVRESPNGVVERAISGVRCRMFAHCAGDARSSAENATYRNGRGLEAAG